MKTPYVMSWLERPEEIKKLTSEGIIPFVKEVGEGKAMPSEFFPSLMGQAVGGITEVKTAQGIVDEMMEDALKTLKMTNSMQAKL